MEQEDVGGAGGGGGGKVSTTGSHSELRVTAECYILHAL